VTSLVGGVLSERYGGTHVIGIATLLSGIITAVSPMLANDVVWYIFATRFLLGVMGVSVNLKPLKIPRKIIT
jgi:hypothetical protein